MGVDNQKAVTDVWKWKEKKVKLSVTACSDPAQNPRNPLKQGNCQEGSCETIYSLKNLTLA